MERVAGDLEIIGVGQHALDISYRTIRPVEEFHDPFINHFGERSGKERFIKAAYGGDVSERGKFDFAVHIWHA